MGTSKGRLELANNLNQFNDIVQVQVYVSHFLLLGDRLIAFVSFMCNFESHNSYLQLPCCSLILQVLGLVTCA